MRIMGLNIGWSTDSDGGQVEPRSLGEPTLHEQVADRISSLNDEAASTLLESIDLLANYVDPFDRFRGPNGQMWQDVGTA
ncbi:MAG TPA: hypothetical protein VMX74_13495, partial [Pirellulales bacterium]|nr:hypothetical protein [Pirellulales bacterium]